MTEVLEIMNFQFNFINKPINVYFVFYILALIVGCLVFVYANKRLKEYREDLFYCFIYVLIGSMIGAKLLYIITILPILIENPSLLLEILSGGMVYYGGVIGGIIGGILYIRSYQMPFLKFFDNLAIALPLGHAIGRLGCFFAGCCYGAPTDSCLGVEYPVSNLVAPNGIAIFPVQLFESILNVILFFVLVLIAKKMKKGQIIGIYLVAYSTIRFILEFFRDDPRGSVLFFSTSQFISIILLAIGIIFIISKYNEKIESFILGKKKSKVESKN